MAALAPRSSANRRASRTMRGSCFISSRNARCCSARSKASASVSMSGGLVTKSYAPTRIAAIAVSMLPNAVSIVTGTSGWLATIRSHSSRPFMPAMFTSVTTASTSAVPTASSAASADVLHVTSKPRCARSAASSLHMSRSSSTMSTRPFTRRSPWASRLPPGAGGPSGRGRPKRGLARGGRPATVAPWR